MTRIKEPYRALWILGLWHQNFASLNAHLTSNRYFSSLALDYDVTLRRALDDDVTFRRALDDDVTFKRALDDDVTF